MTCQSISDEVTAALVPGGAFLDPSSPGNVQTVVVAGVVDRGAAGRRIHLRCPDGRWHSPYCYAPGAPQGDPRWFVEYYGPDVATAFGFEVDGPHDLYVPDRDRIHRAIAELDPVLVDLGHEPIALRFSDPGPSGVTSARDYLHDFGHGARLPLPAVERGIHDYAYHLLSINLPAALVRHSALQAALLLELADRILAWAAGPPHAAALAAMVERLLTERSAAIDYGTGNLAFHTIWRALARRTGAFHFHHQAMLSTPLRLYTDLTGRGAAPASFVRALLHAGAAELPEPTRTALLELADTVVADRAAARPALDVELRLAPGDGPRTPMAEGDALCVLAQVRRRAIAEAARRLGGRAGS